MELVNVGLPDCIMAFVYEREVYLVGERVKPQDRCVLKDDGFYVYGTFEPADGPVHAPAHGALRTIPPCPDAYDCGPHKPPSHVPTANAYL